jgi:hypothetical protein
MGIKEDIQSLIFTARTKGGYDKQLTDTINRVDEWLESPYCVLLDEEELEEGEDDDN